MKEVSIKFKVPRFDKETRKWAREAFQQSMDEICMFGYESDDQPLTYTFSFKGKKVGKLVIVEKLSAKEKKQKVNS